MRSLKVPCTPILWAWRRIGAGFLTQKRSSALSLLKHIKTAPTLATFAASGQCDYRYVSWYASPVTSANARAINSGFGVRTYVRLDYGRRLVGASLCTRWTIMFDVVVPLRQLCTHLEYETSSLWTKITSLGYILNVFRWRIRRRYVQYCLEWRCDVRLSCCETEVDLRRNESHWLFLDELRPCLKMSSTANM